MAKYITRYVTLNKGKIAMIFPVAVTYVFKISGLLLEEDVVSNNTMLSSSSLSQL